MYKEIKYFKGLNALRFFAAYLVVLHHAEQIRLKNDLFNLKSFSLFNNGGLAVTFFFVLSGFLITYLLLTELKQTNDISIKNFYIRRILRIWPLYFLLVIIGTVILPVFLDLINNSYQMPYAFKDVILYYIFFSPFLVNIFYGHHLLEPLWSIGVEELFYIIWAPLLKFFKNNVLTVMLSVFTLKILMLIIAVKFQFSSNVISVIKMLQFESMAIGGLTAYILYHRKNRIEDSILFSKITQTFILLFIFGKIFAVRFLTEHFTILDILYNSGEFSQILITCCFAWLIINISMNKKSLINLNYKTLDFLGEISYGIYMYHMLLIFGIILILKKYLLAMSNFTATLIFYTILTTGVVIVAFISKKVFENYFLSFKSKFRMS